MSSLVKYPWFFVTVLRYHINVVIVCKLKRWQFLLVELCNLSWNHNSLKSLYIIIHKMFGAGRRRWPCFLQVEHN